MTELKKVLLFGRANVGKSTLFNRLTKKTAAIVYDFPGVTRDRREGEGSLAELQFLVVDAPGFEAQINSELAKSMRKQLENGIQESDLVLFVVDLKEGLHDLDLEAGRWLRKKLGGLPIILVANKAENQRQHSLSADFLRLGLGEPILVSAEHNLGFSELYNAFSPHVSEPEESGEDDCDDLDTVPIDEETPAKIQRIDIAILGRPNVGKSTLFNALIGMERSITGDQPGLTRDAITYDIPRDEAIFRLVDTAGLRRQAKITEDLEQLSAKDTLRAIKYSQITLLVIDAQTPLDKQDLLIGQHIIEEGRGLVIVINKWDTVPETQRDAFLDEFRYKVSRTWPQVKDAIVLTISALHRPPLAKIFQSIVKTFDAWNTRISTGKLNVFLKEVVSAHPPPLANGRPINIKYMTQVKKRPPTFALFLSKPNEVPNSYIQYLSNQLRTAFALQGTPIRILIRSGKNPYVSEKHT